MEVWRLTISPTQTPLVADTYAYPCKVDTCHGHGLTAKTTCVCVTSLRVETSGNPPLSSSCQVPAFFFDAEKRILVLYEHCCSFVRAHFVKGYFYGFLSAAPLGGRVQFAHQDHACFKSWCVRIRANQCLLLETLSECSAASHICVR